MRTLKALQTAVIAVTGLCAASLAQAGTSFIEEWMDAPQQNVSCRNDYNCVDRKQDFLKIQVVPIEDSAYAFAACEGLLPSKCIAKLEKEIGTRNVRRAQCDEVVLRFTGVSLPSGPYPVSNHRGEYREPAWVKGDEMAIAINKRLHEDESRAVRVHVPTRFLKSADNPVLAVSVRHNGADVPLLQTYKPEGNDSNTLYSTPRNEERGAVNKLHKQGGIIFMPIVPIGACD